jgi:hypothetical protein
VAVGVGRLVAVALAALLALAAAACGRYGPPLRAEQYRAQEQAQREAEQKRLRETTPQERNDPLPASP